MGSNMKLAAQRLFKIADDLEKEAAENTFFVCDGCNHTASLRDINAKRKVAGENHKVKRVANVSVNDAVTCLACGGKMSYVPTDSSNKYYVESEDTGADIFEPVDEQSDNGSDVADPEKDEAPAIDESVSKTTETPEGEETVSETSDISETPEGDTTEISDYDGNPDKEAPKDEGISTPEGVTPEGAPAPEGDTGESAPETDTNEETPAPEGDMPEGAPAPVPDGGEEPVVEETVTDETVEAPTDEGVPGEEAPVDEDGVVLPKKDVPKFEKIPKDASEDFLRAIAKYSI